MAARIHLAKRSHMSRTQRQSVVGSVTIVTPSRVKNIGQRLSWFRRAENRMCNNCNESNVIRQETRQEQQVLEDMRRQTKEEEQGERRRLEEEVAKHKVHHGKGETPQENAAVPRVGGKFNARLRATNMSFVGAVVYPGIDGVDNAVGMAVSAVDAPVMGRL